MKKNNLQYRYFFSLAILVMAVGVALRLAAYFFTRSLWVDEAMLALNIINRSFPSFFQPLANDQSAPVGFLFLEKGATLLFGIGERSLRLFPLLAGVSALPMMLVVSQKVGGWATVLPSLTLVAVTKYLVNYSNEVKQYSLDVFVTLLLFYSALRVLDNGNENKQKLIVWYVAGGILSVWFSNAALFVVSGLSFALMVVFISQREFKNLRILLSGAVVWIANVVVAYFAFLRLSQENNYLLDYWENGFAPFPPWEDISWYWIHLGKMANNPLGLSVDWLFYLLLIAGVIGLANKRWETLLLILMPIIAVLVASMLKIFPFEKRLILFLAPLVFLILGFGFEAIYLALAKVNQKLAFAVIIGLAILFLRTPVERALMSTINQPNSQNMRYLMETIQKEAKPNDTIYLSIMAQPAYKYYTRLLGVEQSGVYDGVNYHKGPKKYTEEFKNFKGTKRFWYVSTQSMGEYLLFGQSLCQLGVLERKYIENVDLRLYLFDLSKDPSPTCGG